MRCHRARPKVKPLMIRDEAVNWDEDNKEDQLTRSEARPDRAYTENANCEFSGTHLYESVFQCIR